MPTEILSVHRAPCGLLQLPDEVKLEIVKHVQRRRDLYNFSLACRRLEDITLSRLYKSVDLDVPAENAHGWNHGKLPTFRPYVLRNMREFAIRNGVADARNPIYHKRRRSDANTLELYVDDVLKGVPRDRLKTFSFQHQTPLSRNMINRLARHHGRGLRHLQCCEVELLNQPDMPIPSNLHSLECRSIGTGEAVAHVIANNKHSLRSLNIGQDKQLIQRYRERRVGFLNLVLQPLPSFYSILALNTFPNLASLSLTGLDLEPLVPQTVESALFLTQLRSMTFESCLNMAPFLDVMASTFSHVQSPSFTPAADSPPQISLQKFSFRHEFFTNQIRDALIRFLTSFAGLNSLTLLVENTAFTTRPSTFLTPHGPTLETLVLESRIQPREHLEIDTSRPFGNSRAVSSFTQRWLDMITDITTLCPNLIELGIAFPWSDTAVQQAASSVGQSLKSLQTLHIRNLPSSQSNEPTTDNDNDNDDDDTEILNYATRLLQWLSPSPPPNLTTLALGPTLYSTRWRLSAPHAACSPSTASLQTTTQIPHLPELYDSSIPSHTRTQQRTAKATHNPNFPPPYLRTHYFNVVAGGPSAAVTPASERDMQEETHDRDRGLRGVFETVWLR